MLFRSAPGWVLCSAPPGLDTRVDVTLVAGGQVATAVGLVGYAPPAVHSVIPVVPPRTRGGTLVTVIGNHFPVPPWPVVVRVGAELCVVQEASRSGTSLSCTAPRGAGAQPVYVHTLLQTSVDNATLTYASPTIANVATPLGRPLEGGFPVDVTGEVRGSCTAPPPRPVHGMIGIASLLGSSELYCGTMWFVRDEVVLCLRLCSRWHRLWPFPKTISPRPA